MGGHSHWAGIKHKKAVVDAKRGKLWTKIIREITIAAKLGGGNPDNNPRLRRAIDEARAANMPSENIKRGIKKGTGELPGATFEDLTFEGYGPGGVAIFCEGNTDNRNRTTSQVRNIYEEHGGNLGAAGCVAYLFERKGYMTVKKAGVSEDELMGLVLELGAEDMKSDNEHDFEIFTDQQDFEKVRDGLKDKGVAIEAAEVTMIPKTTVAVGEDKAGRLLKLIEDLEDHDDIAHVYANFDIPDSVLASLER